MNVLLILLGFSMLLACSFLVAFLWAVRSGQYNDKYTPSLRVLFDDDDRHDTRGSSTHTS
jgi:cbb3-type cytochrome oxidase maturation protein